jgi:hypothetical protein
MEKKPPEDDRYAEEETARRADEVIKRTLNTPPQPRKAKPTLNQSPIQEASSPVLAG